MWSFGQVCATMLHPGIHTSLIFNTQHVAALRNRVAKRAQHVTPNNVTICGAEMFQSFGRSLQMLGQQCWDMLRSFGRGFKGILCASQSFGMPRTYIARAF